MASQKTSSSRKAQAKQKSSKARGEEARTFADTKVTSTSGGETHQRARGQCPVMTTQQGSPIADDQNSLKAGVRGPVLLEDQIMREKIFHFDHERIPERVVHARGYGARGYFETYRSLKEITSAALFQRKGQKTPAFVRFSTVAGNKGSADLARDVRGFAVKLYTEEGNWDIVGNNMPVFFIQDAIKFPDLIHSVKAEPDRGFPQAQSAHDNFWDFISLMPESMHMVMWAMSDRAIPRSFRFMEGFGVHTFKLINAKGKVTYVKFHWKPKLGMQSVVWNEALKLNGADPDFHRRDLWSAIENGDYPEWELGLQLFDEAFAEKFEFDVLDATKLIPEEQIPIMKVGRLVLNENVDNFFAETEQVAFCTQNIVPGVDFTNDPLLQGRNFSYLDTQTKRLGGPNFTHIPVNAPKCPFHHFQQDGHMAMHNPKGRVNYEPNSWSDQPGPREDANKGFTSDPESMAGEKIRARSETFADHYSQARQFYISQTDLEQGHIADAITFELSKVGREEIRTRVVSHLLNIDKGLAKKVAHNLRIDKLPKAASAAVKPRTDLPVADSLSIMKNMPDSFAGRKIGVLLSDGADAKLYKGLITAAEKEGAMVEVVAPQIGGVELSDGTWVDAQQKINGGPSVLYDAVCILLSEEGAKLLGGEATAKDFVADAFAHLKFIGFSGQAKSLLSKAGVEDLDKGCVQLKKKSDLKDFVTTCRNFRFWKREAKVRMSI